MEAAGRKEGIGKVRSAGRMERVGRVSSPGWMGWVGRMGSAGRMAKGEFQAEVGMTVGNSNPGMLAGRKHDDRPCPEA